jgi:hypothetical protein
VNRLLRFIVAAEPGRPRLTMIQSGATHHWQAKPALPQECRRIGRSARAHADRRKPLLGTFEAIAILTYFDVVNRSACDHLRKKCTISKRLKPLRG